MAEYIDRETLIQDLKSCGCVTVYGVQFINAVISRINLHKAAEVAEVRHGEWVKNESKSKKHIEPIYECSACQNFEAWGDTERTKYCPYCGAIMDGKGDTE